MGGGDAEPELELLAIVDRKTHKEEGARSRAGASTNGVEDNEALVGRERGESEGGRERGGAKSTISLPTV